MGNSKRNRKIILSLILIFIIITGTFFLMKDNDNYSDDKAKENETFQEDGSNKNTKKQKDVVGDTFHYVEKFIGEEDWAISEMFLRYDEKIVKIMEKEKISLIDLENKENIYEFSNEDIIMANGWWIEDNIFWNIKYDGENEIVIVRSFDNKGNEKDNIGLKGFKGIVIDNSYILVRDMKVSEDYIYLLSQTNTQPILQIFTKSGELKISYENVDSFDIDNEGHCVFTTTSSQEFPYRGFFMIDPANGDEIFRNTSYVLRPIRFSDDKKLIYGFDKKINIFDAENGKFIKSVFEFGKDSTYLLDDYDIKDFMVGKDGEIYLSLRFKIKTEEEFEKTGVKNLYYLYTKKEGGRPERETTLTITAPYRYDFMEEAIKRYELRYPKEHVEFNYTYNTYEKFRENSEEYGSKLTLDIIQGNIGDIVQTGGAAVEPHNVLTTDAFMDLTDFIIKDKSYKNLNKNVLDGIKIDDAIRGLPISYMFYQYELNEDLERELGLNIDFNEISWSELLDLVKIIEEKAPDRHLFTINPMEGGSPWESFGFYLVVANMPDLVNLETKEIDLEQEWFKELLIKFKEVSESKSFMFADTEFNFIDRLKGSLLTNIPIRDRYYGDLLAEFNKYNEYNKSRIISNFKGEKNNNRIGYSMRMYSINNRSSRKENAWKFLSFLLEEDIGFIASRERNGIPINKKSVDKMIEDAMWMHNLSGKSIDKYNNLTKENAKKIDYLYDMSYMRADLVNAIKFYMDEEMTLNDALKKAEENIVIRLNE